jgi:hypothetical protein
MFRFIVIIKFFICLFFISKGFSSELVHFKVTTFTTKPKPSINATSIDNTTKWFDDNPSAVSNKELEFGFYLPNNYGLSFRNRKLSGVHLGEATKYVCILGYCSYVGAGIVTGNSTTDKISYDIDSWQIIVDKSYKFKERILFKPRIGINILDTILKYEGTGKNEQEKQMVPLPFLGVHLDYNISGNYSIYLDTNYFKYNETKISIHYYDTSIGINRKINENLKFFLGYKRYDLGMSNKGGKSNISFDVVQNTPFAGFLFSY